MRRSARRDSARARPPLEAICRRRSADSRFARARPPRLPIARAMAFRSTRAFCLTLSKKARSGRGALPGRARQERARQGRRSRVSPPATFSAGRESNGLLGVAPPMRARTELHDGPARAVRRDEPGTVARRRSLVRPRACRLAPDRGHSLTCRRRRRPSRRRAERSSGAPRDPTDRGAACVPRQRARGRGRSRGSWASGTSHAGLSRVSRQA